MARVCGLAEVGLGFWMGFGFGSVGSLAFCGPRGGSSCGAASGRGMGVGHVLGPGWCGSSFRGGALSWHFSGLCAPVFCIRLGLGLLPLLDQFRPPSNVGPISSPPHYLPVVSVSASWCTCCSRCLGLVALVCTGSLPVTPGPCQASACDMSRGLWVHGWIYSGVDGCLQVPWARRCSSLGLLHCNCWVVPLGLSPAFLWGDCGSPGDGSPWVPVLCLWLRYPPYLSQVQAGRFVARYTRYCIFFQRNLVYTSVLTLGPTGV
ncbi:hypothetical protein CHARACLAT_014220 [Characodon lateralis]|uniref:Uncharacterized protein n=1 Tax=Characodon lateralis TaxID=208331 RepID=A0ABU7DSX4_9TELE|nr:hypothetical protein [Characodon lateralis]